MNKIIAKIYSESMDWKLNKRDKMSKYAQKMFKN